MDVRIVRGLSELPRELDALGASRVLVLTTPGRRFLDRLDLGGREVEVFDRATVHVPRPIVEEAERRLDASRADTVLSLGGGSATGLGKALRLGRDVHLVAVPTTWSGSELTDIWGTTVDGRKHTGRDARVRPDLVIHDPTLFATMPKKLMVTSLLNALAHPLGALSAAPLDESLERRALDAVRHLGWALEQLLECPTSTAGHAEALDGMRLGAAVLDEVKMGAHHRVAHLLGGAFGLEHGALHAVLLPHSLRALLLSSEAGAEALAKALGSKDGPAVLYDALVRSGNARSLLALGVDAAAFRALASEHPELGAGWVADAWVGRRPSLRERRWTLDGQPEVSLYGPELPAARRVVVALHGRGSDAGSVARMVRDLVAGDPTVAIVAPQAEQGAWYPLPYHRPLTEHGDAVPAALARVEAVLDRVLAEVGPQRVWLFGFSQGACLAAEMFARSALPLGGLVAPAGARIGAPGEPPPVRRDLSGAPVLLGAAAEDPWLRPVDLVATAESFRAAGADLLVTTAVGTAHHVSGLQRVLARRRLAPGERPPPLVGFGNTLESEALPDALPRHQNTPLPAPYGLFAEHVSGTGFSAPRRDNKKLWLYRIRPSAQHTPFEPLAHPTLGAEWGPADPNLCGYRPIALPTAPTDLVDGLATWGGAGSPALRRGYAVHLYAATASMDDRAFCDADGDLLVVPWDGRLTLLTETGVLEVAPGQIALLPRGVRFSALLPDGRARGWVAEVYGRSFELPERGPVGANGLADPRHFRAPEAWFEDRLAPGYRITTKLGNVLYAATQDHSPYDVVAWSGNHLPFVYDLMDFSPVMNGRVDHIDPSVHTVLHAPLDEPGASGLAFVLFAPRWDSSEHTFRPPYFHRNVITEINGIISDPSLDPSGPFSVGGMFATPSFTPHGVLARGVERVYTTAADAPHRAARVPDGSLWFQFETTLPLQLTAWAMQTPSRIADWPHRWGAYRTHFDPP